MVNYKKIFMASVLATAITFTGCTSNTANKSVPSNSTSSTSNSAESKQPVSISGSIKEMKAILVSMRSNITAKQDDKNIGPAGELAQKWQGIQNNVRTNFSDLYPNIQEPMNSIDSIVKTKPINTKKLSPTIRNLYKQLELLEEANAIPDGTKSMRETVKKMKNSLSSNDKSQIVKYSDDLQDCWKNYSKQVKTKSPKLYTRTEEPLNEISSDVKKQDLDNVAVAASLDNLDGVLAQIYELK